MRSFSICTFVEKVQCSRWNKQSFGFLVKRKKRGEVRDKEEEKKKGKVVWHGRERLGARREAQTVLSTPAAFREAFCQH